MSVIPRDTDLEKRPNESPEDWAKRVAEEAQKARDDLATEKTSRAQAIEVAESERKWKRGAGAAAIAIFLLLCFVLWWNIHYDESDKLSAEVAKLRPYKDEAGRLAGENKTLSDSNAKLKGELAQAQANTKEDATKIETLTAENKSLNEQLVDCRNPKGSRRSSSAGSAGKSRTSVPSGNHECKAHVAGKVVADFITGDNPKGIRVTTYSACRQELDNFWATHPQYRFERRVAVPPKG